MGSRIADALLEGGYARPDEKMLDLKYGGQQGWSPRLGRVGSDSKVYSEWISNQAYVSKNIIAVVLEAPKFFKYMPDPTKWIATYKALMEIHPITIDGLQSGLTVETAEHAVGGAGEMQEEIIDVKRARSTISYTWIEKAGKPIKKFLETYIRYALMDPDTKSALVGTLPDFQTDLYTADYAAGTILFFEPDITNRFVIEAWLCGNMMPKGTGDITGKRDKNSAGETKEVSVEFTSITMYNDSVKQLAQKILDQLLTHAVNPNEIPAFAEGISSSLSDENAPYGFTAQAANV